MSPKISIIVINYNTEHFLKTCLESLQKQTYKNKEIIIIDNNSQDNSCTYIQKEWSNTATIICNPDNKGYSGAANQGINIAKGEYIMLLGPDIQYEKDYIEKSIKKMEEDKKIGVIGGKLKKYDYKKGEKTNKIDSVGIFSYRNRRIIDLGQGEEDTGQFNKETEVFGVSGASPIYRKTALEEIKLPPPYNEYLDNDFFMYKEDIDISWRLRLKGWKAYYIPEAVAYHGRGTGTLNKFTHTAVFKNRSHLSKFQKYFAYRNQRLMQIKNEFIKSYLHNFFPILWKEILITGYIIFFEPHLIKATFSILKLTPKMLKKRRHIMKNATIDWREIEKWFKTTQ